MSSSFALDPPRILRLCGRGGSNSGCTRRPSGSRFMPGPGRADPRPSPARPGAPQPDWAHWNRSGAPAGDRGKGGEPQHGPCAWWPEVGNPAPSPASPLASTVYGCWCCSGRSNGRASPGQARPPTRDDGLDTDSSSNPSLSESVEPFESVKATLGAPKPFGGNPSCIRPE